MATPYRLMTPEQKTRAHAANKRWKDKNKEKRAAYRHKHYMENREKFLHIERERAYQSRYGIGVAEYDAMLAAQNGVCKICGTDKACLTGKFRFFSVDHDHQNGKVRGLLCTKCNGTLGWYELHKHGIEAYIAPKQ